MSKKLPVPVFDRNAVLNALAFDTGLTEYDTDQWHYLPSWQIDLLEKIVDAGWRKL